eukprot:m.310520 g.310520  ORF g.310520 m.310520 type:complete len:805 (+) comp52191_c0_seq1:125-2539(+)
MGNEKEVSQREDRPKSEQRRSAKGVNIPARALAFALLIGSTAVAIATLWTQTKQVNVPRAAARATNSTLIASDTRDKEMKWGSYRPHVYFGLRTREPQSSVFGLMWMHYQTASIGRRQIRHFCRHEDYLTKYGWTYHDGKSFGIQDILEKTYKLQTSFLKYDCSGGGVGWTARVSGRATSTKNKPPSGFSIMFYVYNEGEQELRPVLAQGSKTDLLRVDGVQGNMSLHFPTNTCVRLDYMAARVNRIDDLHNFIDKQLKAARHPKDKGGKLLKLPGTLQDKGSDYSDKHNLVVYQITTEFPFEYDIVLVPEHGNCDSPTDASYVKQIKERKAIFDKEFEDKFQLKSKGYKSSQMDFAKSIFSNLIGGIGYFYGKSKVISKALSSPVDYWAAGLYTAVPSRSFFPRGFLWDEGFHQLVIEKWDPLISADVIAHWLDLMNADGWIPREQILGHEALSRVPEEFVVQHAENANPPTFFLTLEAMLDKLKSTKTGKDYLKLIFPRLQAWFDWFNKTQAGEQPTSYYWKGRNSTTSSELNPKTLMSGLDDYPRATHPSNMERHLDLRCWMALASGVMANIAYAIGNSNHTLYAGTHEKLTDTELLDKLHWSEKDGSYCDYGLHSPKVTLKATYKQNDDKEMIITHERQVHQEITERFVPDFGYVSLFPVLMKILKPDSPKLGMLLEKLRNEKVLWTRYGLRSLAANSRFYQKANTEHDKPYWRGAIWINVNYMAVRSLHHYGSTKGPHQARAKAIYEELRGNLVKNIFRQYQSTGYVWESYNDVTGQGKGTHPFTGWTTLVLLMMGEKY